MADIMDEASDVSEMLLANSLRNRAKVEQNTGFCLYCEEPTEGAFCSKECREDYEAEQKMKRISGK